MVNLLKDAVMAKHIWAAAYDKGGVRPIPRCLIGKSHSPANLFTGNKTEKNEYISFAAITDAKADECSKKIVFISEL